MPSATTVSSTPGASKQREGALPRHHTQRTRVGLGNLMLARFRVDGFHGPKLQKPEAAESFTALRAKACAQRRDIERAETWLASSASLFMNSDTE